MGILLVGIENQDDEHNNDIGRLWGMAAAATGDSTAQYNYAITFERGNASEADLRRAVRYYRVSARQGNIDALCNLAALLIEGNGVKQDIIKGIELMDKALDQNNPLALYVAGLNLMDGDIVE